MRVNFQTKILALCGAFAALVTVIIVAVVAPTVLEIKALRRDTRDLRIYLEKKSQRSSRVHLSLQKIKKMRGDSQALTESVFHAGGELKLITALEALAAEAGVEQKVESSNLDAISNQRLDLTLATAGSWRAQLHYLAALERLKYWLTVRQLEITPEFDREKPDRVRLVRARLTLSLYVAD